MANPTPARNGAPGVEFGGAAYERTTMQRLKREAKAIGVIVIMVALACGVCAVFGDNVGVGPYP